MTSRTCRRCEISKSWLGTLPLRQKIHHFFFSHTWGTRFKYLPKLCPYILVYSAFHIMQWFSHILDVFTPKIRGNFSIFTFYESRQISLTQDLNWSLGRSIALQLQRQTDLLLRTINYFLQWDILLNMAVGDLAFYYTLYLCSGHALVDLVHLVLRQDVASLLKLCMAKWLRKWRRGWLYIRSNKNKKKQTNKQKRKVSIVQSQCYCCSWECK